jgi:conjugal transfer pilus assembly protein TraW
MKFSKLSTFVAIAYVLTLSCPGQAGDLGAIGPTFSIAEPDMLEWIEKRVADKVKSGEFKKMQDEQVAKIKHKLENPEPLTTVTKAVTNRSMFFDPTMLVKENVLDGKGKILVAAGTMINPLDKITMSRPLVFFDARDPDQVAFAKKYIDSRNGLPMPVLVGGSYFDLMKKWDTPVYFDQKSNLIRRFGIRFVPAIVYQEQKRIRVDEIAL